MAKTLKLINLCSKDSQFQGFGKKMNEVITYFNEY